MKQRPRRPRRNRRPPGRRFAIRFSLRKAMFVLPNLFTVSSIFCGFWAIILAGGTPTPAQMYQATMAIFFGIFFDMADGRVARLTRTQSDFGVQIDSLADVMTFGLAPAVVVHKASLGRLHLLGTLIAFLYVACGAIRLARFNVMAARSPGGSKKYFIGLPIPLAAGVLMSVVMFQQRMQLQPTGSAQILVLSEANVIALVLVLAYLMVSNVRYRTFKDVKINRRSLSVFVGALILFGGLAAAIQPTFALLAFFSGYLALGLVEEVVFFRRRRDEPSTPVPPEAPMPPSPESSTGPDDAPLTHNKSSP